MSKETYQLFEEKDKEVCIAMDKVQRAVDRYIQMEEQLPIIDNDPYYRINYFKLNKYLDEPVDIEFYLTSQENLITDKKEQAGK